MQRYSVEREIRNVCQISVIEFVFLLYNAYAESACYSACSCKAFRCAVLANET